MNNNDLSESSLNIPLLERTNLIHVAGKNEQFFNLIFQQNNKQFTADNNEINMMINESVM